MTLIVFCCFVSSAFADETASSSISGKDTLSAEELLKTKAGQAFIGRRYSEALSEFLSLTEKYPKDMVVKRYTGSCLYQLGLDDQAADAFKKILEINPGDIFSRQTLAKLHLRNGDLDQAAQEFTFVVQNDPQGKYHDFANAQLETIKRLKKQQEAAAAEGRISPNQFLKTKAAQYFAAAKFEPALKELQLLETQYPQDVLIKRYDQALAVFGAVLKMAPDSIPARYFMGQTFFHQGQFEKAVQQLKIVVERDIADVYKQKSLRDIESIQKIAGSRRPYKKFSGEISSGFEFNQNATSESSIDKEVVDEHGFIFP